jgi:cell division protease FtsH
VSATIRGILFWILVFLIVIYGLNYFTNKKPSVELRYDQFIGQLNAGNVSVITINESAQRVDGKLKDGSSFFSTVGNDPEIWKFLREKSVNVTVKPPEQVSLWMSVLLNILPIAVLIIVGYLIFKQMQGAGNSAFSFVRSRAKLFTSNQAKATFADVAGVDEAKEELKEVIGFLKSPQKY